MSYAHGSARSWPTISPPWAYGGFPPGYPNPFWNPFSGYGTAPFSWDGTLPTFGMGYGPPTYVPRNDTEIKDFVERAIDSDPMVPPDADISVQVQNGVVTLTGTVPNKRIKHAAGDDAWWVPPVRDVHNEIQIVSRRERAAGAEEAPPTRARAVTRMRR